MSDKYIGEISELDFSQPSSISKEGLDVLKHWGVKRRSGRYPYGSGKKGHQHTKDFISQREEMKKKGMSDNDIASALGMSTTEYRSRVTVAKEEIKNRNIKQVKTMTEDGKSVAEIAERTGLSKQSVRNYQKEAKDPTSVNRKQQTSEVVDKLGESVERFKYLDVGLGVEKQIGISQQKMESALKSMEQSGDFEVHKLYIKQVTNDNQYTNMKVLTKKGVERQELYDNLDKIRPIDFTMDRASGNLQNLQTPKSIDWDRVKIKYAIPAGEKGHGTDADGATMDGAMFIRPGVKDLSMGNAKYAQVRIAVGGTHYLKGMALYGDEKDFPKGVDIIFNTNKTKDKSPQEVLKELKGPLDSANPFGATLKKQGPMLDDKGNPVEVKLKDAKGKEHIKRENGAINIVNEQGDWSEWSKSLSAQFLSKQPSSVVKERLDATRKQIQKEYEEIQKVSNPVIKQKLLESFSSDLEGKQVHLKAQAPSGFQGHVILPIPKMKENEVYAPNYKDGERVILIRYPHGGTFEIPELIVNNKGPGKKVVGPTSQDAIGIHPKVAAKLSGADFDGDTAYVIPNNQGKYKSRGALAGLKDFEPKDYQDPEGTFKPIAKKYQQIEMGKVSNLITDMTLQKATDAELAAAVRHSMVVIDAYKHKLNYKRSEEENNIPALRKKYQTHIDRVNYPELERYNRTTRKMEKIIDPAVLKKTGEYSGTSAATIISRHKQEAYTGGKYVEIPDKNNPNKMKLVIRGGTKTYITNMVDDASVFLNKNSTVTEKHYVNYVNDLKALKKDVDKNIDTISLPKRDPKAALIYANEVKSLDQKLDQSLLNQPKERMAQLLATKNLARAIEERGGYSSIDKEDIKKLKQQAINGARDLVGAKRTPVKITDDEWDAIQANAISPTKLQQLVRHMDDQQLKELATPRPTTTLSDSRKAKAYALLDNGYTMAEVANALGVSPSSISKLNSDRAS